MHLTASRSAHEPPLKTELTYAISNRVMFYPVLRLNSSSVTRTHTGKNCSTKADLLEQNILYSKCVLKSGNVKVLGLFWERNEQESVWI